MKPISHCKVGSQVFSVPVSHKVVSCDAVVLLTAPFSVSGSSKGGQGIFGFCVTTQAENVMVI